jgi:anaerobic selenocysteine-containing dehydrogenase
MATIDRVAEPWGERTPYAQASRLDAVVDEALGAAKEHLPQFPVRPGSPWPVRVDQYLADGIAEGEVNRWVQSSCVRCSNSCGMDIAVKDERIVGVRGRAVDGVNHGRLGPEGLFGWQANNTPDRLTRPLVREGGRLVETDWDEAMGRIVTRTRQQLAKKGPLSIGFYTSGQLFLADLHLAIRNGTNVALPR